MCTVCSSSSRGYDLLSDVHTRVVKFVHSPRSRSRGEKLITKKLRVLREKMLSVDISKEMVVSYTMALRRLRM